MESTSYHEPRLEFCQILSESAAAESSSQEESHASHHTCSRHLLSWWIFCMGAGCRDARRHVFERNCWRMRWSAVPVRSPGSLASWPVPACSGLRWIQQLSPLQLPPRAVSDADRLKCVGLSAWTRLLSAVLEQIPSRLPEWECAFPGSCSPRSTIGSESCQLSVARTSSGCPHG
jgi:hypothetical protein